MEGRFVEFVARIGTLAIAFAAVAVPVPAAAQDPPASPPQTLDSAVRVGDTAWVDTTSGQVRKGRVFGVSGTSLELLRDQRKEVINVNEIRRVRIEYADRLTDGTKRGALAGLGVGVLTGVILAASDCDREGPSFFELCSAGGFGVLSGFFGGLGAGIGALAGLFVDTLNSSSREVWRPHAGSVKVELTLVATPGGLGAGIQIRW